MNLEDKAAIAAFEAIVKCEYVSREELKSWNVSSELDPSKIYYTFAFRNPSGSRQIEVVVHARVKPCKSGGEKMTVEITKVVEGHKNTLVRPIEGNVLFKRTITDHASPRMCAA